MNLLPGAGELTNTENGSTLDRSNNGSVLIVYVKETKKLGCFGFCSTVDADPMECITVDKNYVHVNNQIQLEKIEHRDVYNRSVYNYKPNEKGIDRNNWILQQDVSQSEYNLRVFYIALISNLGLIGILTWIFQILSVQNCARVSRYYSQY